MTVLKRETSRSDLIAVPKESGAAQTATSQGTRSPLVDYEDAPLRSFHLRLAIGSAGGVFSDGFGLGIIGISLSAAAAQLDLTPLWLGLLGAGSLAGLFAGALLTGPVADRFGRRPIFAYNMAVLAVFSLAQFFVTSTAQLLVLRLILGFVLGTDYVVCKTLLTEFSPRRVRGRLLSSLSIAWAAGYVCAYVAGYGLAGVEPDAWRWMLATGALPALLILPLRITVPESPLWLVDHGHAAQATRIVCEKLGANVALPVKSELPSGHEWRWKQLLSRTWRCRTLVGCTFFTCQVIPYFAVGTFVTKVMAALKLPGGYFGSLIYNLFLLVGSVLGLLVVDRISRRSFLIGGFAVTTVTMLVLSAWQALPPVAIVVLFAVLAAVLSASQNLVYVYLPEIFPTELRASGIGVAIAASRVGSAAGTFLLPIVVADFGVHMALGACVIALAFGGVVCLLWAPETRNLRLDASEPLELRARID